MKPTNQNPKTEHKLTIIWREETALKPSRGENSEKTQTKSYQNQTTKQLKIKTHTQRTVSCLIFLTDLVKGFFKQIILLNQLCMRNITFFANLLD